MLSHWQGVDWSMHRESDEQLPVRAIDRAFSGFQVGEAIGHYLMYAIDTTDVSQDALQEE